MTPPRNELKVRLAISLAGLGLLIAAILYRGWPPGIAMLEVIVIAGAFFGGTAAWTLWKLLKS